jgi:hypothetical protein
MPARLRWLSGVLLLTLLVVTDSAQAAPAAGPPPIRHVFVLLLENQSDAVTFAGNSPSPYLAHTLPAEGVRLAQYYAIGHASLDNYIALISGQAPNHETQLDCGVYSDFRPSAARLDANGQLPGGCVYPKLVPTLPDQLESQGLTWRAYMEDMGNNPAREPATCAHVRIGSPEPTQEAQIGDQYATRHNPFVYFHSIIDDARCDGHIVNLERLPQDLRHHAWHRQLISSRPICNDGHDASW